jgi:hypothetical protein
MACLENILVCERGSEEKKRDERRREKRGEREQLKKVRST